VTVARPIKARAGKVTVEIDSALSAQIDAMVRSMAPAVSGALDDYLNAAEAYVAREYPRPGDSRFPTATGNSRDAFDFLRTVEERAGGTILSASVENDASNYGKISRLRGRRVELQAALDRGDSLTPEELRELRVIEALERQTGRKGLVPYVVFVHRGHYWQTIRRMRKDAERAIVAEAAAELRRLAGG
jgi:hypothetical protein